MSIQPSSIKVNRIYSEGFSIIEEVIKLIRSPSLLGYHTPQYMNALTNVLHDNPLYLVAYSEDKIVGFMPLRWRNGTIGPVINSLPFFGPNGGPVFTQAGLSCMEVVVEALCGALMKLAHELDAVSVALYTPFMVESPVLSSAFVPDRAIDKFTQYISIEGSSLRWPTRSRRAVMRAKNKGCRVRKGTPDDLGELLAIYKENCKAAQIPLKPDAYFYQVINTLCCSDIARFTVAEHNGRIVACLITIQYGMTVSYNVPCSRLEDRTLQANSLLIDDAVEHFKQCGYIYWNWESSPDRQHPVYEFKKNWGSIETKYHILLKYPRGLAPFTGSTPAEIALAYPFYFVIPFYDMECRHDS